MECLGQLCSILPCLWECSAKHTAFVTDLEHNLESLGTAMQELNNLNQDVEKRVVEAEERQRRPRKHVRGWLDSVKALERKVNPILEKASQEVENKCVGSCCPKNCWSSYKLGKEVLKLLPKVQGLVEKGCFDDVADDNLIAAPVDELPMEGPVVGFKSKFQEVWHSIQGKDSSIVGLVGIGGVSKTTLLKQLNNEFLKTDLGFDVVVWIVVSKPADLGRIREVIRNKLNIPNHLWEGKSVDQRASLIYNKLKQKKFVVLLDDLWEMLKLSELGIPIPQRGVDNMSRVVFTTRFKEVCRSLDAHKIIKVGCLPPNQALDLFKSKVGEDVSKYHPQMQQLIKDVANECGGLPLALITIGRAMRDKKDPQQWKDAKRTLKMYPSTFPGMKGEIFSKLIFSYDSLSNPTIQKCFEYCCLFPEDHVIKKNELIRLWIAEGIIDEYGNIHDALMQGRQIVDSLMQACLLEFIEWNNSIKMHDVIRDMAFWLACERGEKRNKFLVVDMVNGDDHGMLVLTQRRNGEKVSLWGNGITVKSLAGLSFGSNLTTLIIRRTAMKVLPTDIFESMKTLKVLDLFDNKELTELPAEIGCLINLEYLNTAATLLRRLPVEVHQLKKLRFLWVSYCTYIPPKIISSLCLLQVFGQKIVDIVKIDYASEVRAMEREMLGELEGLDHIMELSLVLRDPTSVQILSNSPKLQCCTRYLNLCGCKYSSTAVLDLSAAVRLNDHLEKIHMIDCDMLVMKLGSSCSPFGNIRSVTICDCDNIRNVSSLIYIPNLCILGVAFCSSIEELIGEDEVMMEKKMEETSGGDEINDNVDHSLSSLFSSLSCLLLSNLPKLRSICPQSALPSLKTMNVLECKSLKKLPFNSNTAITIHPQFILGIWQKSWWDELQWDSQETKDAFTSKRSNQSF